MPKKNLWVKIEASEDVALGVLARERESSFKQDRALRHDQVWKRPKRSLRR